MSVNADSEQRPLLSAVEPSASALQKADSKPYINVARTASLAMSFFNLSQNVLGAGAFGIPAAIAATGLGGGVFLLVVLAVVAMFTLLVLTYFVNTLQQQTYQGLITHTLGKRVAFIAQLLVLVYTFGSGVIYLQQIRDNLSTPLIYWFGNNWYTDPRFLITVYTIIPGSLSFLRQMAKLSYGSSFGVMFVIYSVFFVAIDGGIYLTQEGVKDAILGFNPSIAFAQGFPTMVFAYMTHVGFPPIAAELINPTTLRTSAVVSSSFGLCIALYFAIGIIGYLRIGENCFYSLIDPVCLARFPYLEMYNKTGVQVPSLGGNILNFYPPAYIPAIIARFGMCVTLAMGYPLSTFVGRLTCRTLFNRNREFSTLAHFLITLVWVLASLTIAVFVKDIGVVFTFIGSTGGAWFMIVFPALMLLVTFRDNIVAVILCVALAVFGVAAGIISIVAKFLPS